MGKHQSSRILIVIRQNKTPLMRERNCKRQPCGALQSGHLVRGAQAAILTSLFRMPVYEDEGEAEYDQYRDGASN
jgi:hypothetical protein